jgi:hypothetical protein
VGVNVGHNRRRKALERTWSWFQRSQDHFSQLSMPTNLIGTIVIDFENHKNHLKILQMMIQRNVKGKLISPSFGLACLL